MSRVRCPWAEGDPLMTLYHDEEWGVPRHDDTRLFEYMILDLFQAGLSWRTILHKREAFRKAFADFDVDTIANFASPDIERLLQDTGIVRNRLKIEATVINSRITQKMKIIHGSLDAYLWGLAGGKTRVNQYVLADDIPAADESAITISKQLRQAGFKFLGPVVWYSFMQGAGMVNDHLVSCYRYYDITNASE